MNAEPKYKLKEDFIERYIASFNRLIQQENYSEALRIVRKLLEGTETTEFFPLTALPHDMTIGPNDLATETTKE